MLIADSVVEQFERDGVIVLPQLARQDETTAITTALRHIVRAFIRQAVADNPETAKPHVADGEETSAGMMFLEQIDHKYMEYVYDTIWRTPPFLRLVANPDLVDAINQLQQRSPDTPRYAHINRCRIQLPNDPRSTVGWHQDVLQTIPGTSFLQVWAPLVRDVRESDGALQVCVGSHLADLPLLPWAENANGVCKIFFDGSVVEKQFEVRSLDLDVGDVAIFSGRLIHRSGINSSKRPRYALVGLYHDVGDPDFLPLRQQFAYRGRKPKQYYDDLAVTTAMFPKEKFGRE